MIGTCLTMSAMLAGRRSSAADGRSLARPTPDITSDRPQLIRSCWAMSISSRSTRRAWSLNPFSTRRSTSIVSGSEPESDRKGAGGSAGTYPQRWRLGWCSPRLGRRESVPRFLAGPGGPQIGRKPHALTATGDHSPALNPAKPAGTSLLVGLPRTTDPPSWGCQSSGSAITQGTS
jgi:hypothetical protein